MPLRKRFKQLAAPEPAADGHLGKLERKQSKRQRLASFFGARSQKRPLDKAATHISTPSEKTGHRESPPRSEAAECTLPSKLEDDGQAQIASADDEEVEKQSLSPTPPAEARDEPGAPKVEQLGEDQLHALFSGAPHFFIRDVSGRRTPSASYPWDENLKVRDVSDSVQLAHPAFSAATLHRHLPVLAQSADQEKKYQGYNLEVVEVPSMLSAQGIEPATIGLAHFLELPRSDSLITDLQQSQTSNDILETSRNKELMQSTPGKLGIRKVDMDLVHDRLVEFGDLFEAFHDSPERMTILNNQSSGDLYANLFGKFLMPPGYDGSADDPTGLKVQIDTLLRVLGLRGVWYDFSLVEWRIRLGQILWSDSEMVADYDSTSEPLWSERDILLLQITLACELLLRLDAVTSMDAEDVISQIHVSAQDFRGFIDQKTRKTDWDLVLARKFLENILVVKEPEIDDASAEQKPGGLLALLNPGAIKDVSKPASDVILLPRHQTRQLAGLFYFAEAICWAGMDHIATEMAQRLGVQEAHPQLERTSSVYGKYMESSAPTSPSVYATPLATPRSIRDGYFGHMQKPVLRRNDSRSLQVPISTTLIAHADGSGRTMNVGGWLTRSYLTGLILPGEAVSHFLISTLLENDQLAIAALGDSANLYGGFVFADRTWWSKTSIVARVLGCVDGAAECMGWVSFAKLPEGRPDGWYAIDTMQIASEQPPRIASADDLLARDAALIPGDDEVTVDPTDLVLPTDADATATPAVGLVTWSLTPVDADGDDALNSPADLDTYTASLTFRIPGHANVHSVTLSHDVQFVTSWPCTPPASSAPVGIPQVLKRSHTQPITLHSPDAALPRSASNRSSRHFNRRSSHGFEPLLSHPPESSSIAPTPIYSPLSGEEPGQSAVPLREPMNAHPLHVSYKYKIIPATDVLDPALILPFTMRLPLSSMPNSPIEESSPILTVADNDNKTVLVLDARGGKDAELLARAWCAKKGLHAIVGRAGRTCLACCVREARGIGVNVVIRV